MNWLAHVLISKRSIEYQLGNVLADPMKGRYWPAATEELRAGMKMHRAIDKFTDKHDLIREAKSLFGIDGHLKGVVLDLLFDHFLSRHWESFCRLDKKEFLHRFHHEAKAAAQFYPAKPQRIVFNIISSELLSKYASYDGFIEALRRIDMRLSARAKARETTMQYLDTISVQYSKLEALFMSFFPNLIAFFKSHELGSPSNHYLLD